MSPQLSLVHGAKEPPLWLDKTLCAVIDEKGSLFPNRTARIVPWQATHLSYRQLADRSRVVAKALLGAGLRHGDCIGNMNGNSYKYIEVFLVLHQSACRTVFIAPTIGTRSLMGHFGNLLDRRTKRPRLLGLQQVIPFRTERLNSTSDALHTYTHFLKTGIALSVDHMLSQAQAALAPEDVLNLQLTSGTTSSPKAAMLTNINILNNARFVGDAMRLPPSVVVSYGPPLFHCLGLVMGFSPHRATAPPLFSRVISFPCSCVVDALMLGTRQYSSLFWLREAKSRVRLRTGFASGSAVSQTLMIEIRESMGVDKMLIAYGTTETSPVSFITSLDDPEDKRISTIGRVMPHMVAKVVDKQGRIVPRGQKGELCVSGYALQNGYWKNEEKTREAMKRGPDGVLWRHIVDEVAIHEEGYGHLTGRVKDLIIRGGENSFPREIEDRLVAHGSISESSVIEIKDEKYGEVVSCFFFLKAAPGCQTVSDIEIQQGVESTLARHKSPRMSS
ncbi:hypothetical protein BDW68DRAFT_189262 [Aspergillus falconensis]